MLSTDVGAGVVGYRHQVRETPTLFVDESGSTGEDLHQVDQSIFVHVGLWLDSAQVTAIDSELIRLHALYRLQPPLADLKGRVLVKTPRGQKFVRDVLKALAANRIAASIQILDKPFLAAAVLLEDCCDYAYNSAFDVSWTWYSAPKERLAERVYDVVSAPLLEDAWTSRRKSSIEMRTAYERVFRILQLSAEEELVVLARRMGQTDFDELFSAIKGASEELDSNYSPNLSTFDALIQSSDQHASDFDIAAQSVNVVHDEQLEFAPVFSRWFSVWRNCSPAEISYPNGETRRLPLRHLNSLTFARSEDHVGIRVADVVAAAVRLAVSRRNSATALDYFPALRAYCCSRPLMGSSPGVIASLRTQSAVWNLLAPMDEWVRE